jgi:hypothetical protein
MGLSQVIIEKISAFFKDTNPFAAAGGLMAALPGLLRAGVR